MLRRAIYFTAFLSCLWSVAVFTTSAETPSLKIATTQAAPVYFTPLASGFNLPTDIAATTIPGDQRIFIAQQSGLIRIIDTNGNVLPQPFLDISDRTMDQGERGLLGLTFHPNYAQNGYFYVNYNDLGGETHIARFQVTADANIADRDTEKLILFIDQPFDNHNGGDLAFGLDGMLYIGMGDGGSGGDPGNRAQNANILLGKMLRIDVDGGDPYAIPPDNPYVGNPNARGEVWHIGLRNPWRFSFDRMSGDLFIGDVGQNKWEEIDHLPSGSKNKNFGWRCFEGNHIYNDDNCAPQSAYIAPIHEYDHSVGSSITGGFIYRGQDWPVLNGLYFFADFANGKLWTMSAATGWQPTLRREGGNISTFGEDGDGELLFADYSGTIYRISAPELTNKTFLPLLNSGS